MGWWGGGGGGFWPNILSLLVLIEMRIRIKTRLWQLYKNFYFLHVRNPNIWHTKQLKIIDIRNFVSERGTLGPRALYKLRYIFRFCYYNYVIFVLLDCLILNTFQSNQVTVLHFSRTFRTCSFKPYLSSSCNAIPSGIVQS